MSKARNLSKLQPDSSGALPSASIGADAITADKIAPDSVSDSELTTGAAVANIGYTPANQASLGTLATVTPTGTASASTYLRGDNAWATITQLPIVVDPTNTSPANGSTDIYPGQTLTASGFYALYNYTFANAQWQVSTNSGFTTTVYDSGTSGAAVTSISISSSYITTGTTYYWRVRYKASDGTWTNYSTPSSFTTASAFSYTINYMVVAGGGGGAAGRYNGTAGGAGGAGGLKTGSATVTVGVGSYSLTIGAGGNPGTNGGECCGENGAQGGSTSGFGLSCTGGGYGGGPNSAAGGSGGSGGGGDYSTYGPWNGGAGSGISGEGNSGSAGNGGGGGGGGKNAAASAYNGGTGYTWLNGLVYATGGTGAVGSFTSAAQGTDGGTGTGNGGWGGRGGSRGGYGGGGVVVVSYLGGQKGSGGTVTSSNGYTHHTFTSSGTFYP